MPVYEYACKSCGHHLEVSQSFKDDPLTTCPVCGGALRKVFNSIGIVLQGSGFYRTDSRLPSKSAKGEKGEKGEKAASGEKAESKSESKSDTKVEAKPKAAESTSSSSSSTKTA